MAAFQNQQSRPVISSKPPMSMPSYGSQRGFQAYGPNNTPAAQEWERRWGRVVNGRKSSDLDIGPADDRRQADELAAWQQYGYDAVNRQPPPAYVDYGPGTPGVQKPQYGSRIGMPDGAIRTMDHIDRDGDGIDDRSQSGPGQRPANAGAAQPSQPPSQGTPYGQPQIIRADDGVDFRRKGDPIADVPVFDHLHYRPRHPSPPANPPDFEGPLPGPRDPQGRQARIDDIYNQLINGSYNAHLRGKNHAGASHVLQQNARRLATRLAADGVPARYFDQYGIRPPGSQPGSAQPVDPPNPGTPYNPGFGDDVRYRPGDMPGGPDAGMNDPAFKVWRRRQYTDMRYRPPGSPEAKAFEQRMYEAWQRENAGGQLGQPRSSAPTQPMFGPYGPPNGQDPVSQLGQMYQQQMLAWAQPKQQLLQWGQQQSQMPWGPNYGNTPDSRPAPWSQQVSGPFGNDPNGMWNNMSGFIQSVNNQAMQKPVGVYQGQGNPGANYGKQTYDIRSLINQGNQMVQGGWQNPYMGQMQQLPQWY